MSTTTHPNSIEGAVERAIALSAETGERVYIFRLAPKSVRFDLTTSPIEADALLDGSTDPWNNVALGVLHDMRVGTL